MKATISLAQMNIQLGEPYRNLEKAMTSIRAAAGGGSDLLLLPELWSTGYDLSNGPVHARTNLALIEQLKQAAAKYHIHIGGSFLLQEPDGGIYNTFVLLPPDQSDPVVYRKIHLFRLMDEEKWLKPGIELSQQMGAWGQTGLAVCYDLRFPEMFRHYALDGVQIVLLVAEWPLRRVEHWKVLARARAIENQMFFAAVNAVGMTGNETFGGASIILSPWGEPLAEADTFSETLITAEFDMDLVREVRERIPIFADRRPEIY